MAKIYYVHNVNLLPVYFWGSAQNQFDFNIRTLVLYVDRVHVYVCTGFIAREIILEKSSQTQINTYTQHMVENYEHYQRQMENKPQADSSVIV